jgi:hypothetical protein
MNEHNQSLVETAANAINSAPMTLKNGPPVATTALALMGITLDQWVLAATLIWLLLQIGGWCYDRYQKHVKEKVQVYPEFSMSTNEQRTQQQPMYRDPSKEP